LKRLGVALSRGIALAIEMKERENFRPTDETG
jgi:hypothetical protein